MPFLMSSAFPDSSRTIFPPTSSISALRMFTIRWCFAIRLCVMGMFDASGLKLSTTLVFISHRLLLGAHVQGLEHPVQGEALARPLYHELALHDPVLEYLGDLPRLDQARQRGGRDLLALDVDLPRLQLGVRDLSQG